jgi:cytochrome c-type biogenesis protein CcmE
MSRKLLVGTVLLGVGILAATFGLFRPKPVYARSVAEFIAHPIQAQTVRLEGTLVPGSLCRRSAPCEYRFRIRGGWSRRTDAGQVNPDAELSVRYPQCLMPDTFREEADPRIVVEGELCAGCHRFEVSQLFVRTHLKYEMKEPDWKSPAKPTVLPPACTSEL